MCITAEKDKQKVKNEMGYSHLCSGLGNCRRDCFNNGIYVGIENGESGFVYSSPRFSVEVKENDRPD